jgi:hypothetical protein
MKWRKGGKHFKASWFYEMEETFFLQFCCVQHYVEFIELISKVTMDWMLSSLVWSHGTHSNGVGQGPNNNIYVIHSFMEYHI